MKPCPARHHRHASAARMFVLFFGGLVLAGILLIALASVVKTKTTPPGKKPVPASHPNR